MGRIYSAGIILYRVNNTNVEFFVCSPGGPEWKNKVCWNFPKGHVENNEDPLQTAYREFFEETGISLDTSIECTYEGLIPQNKTKSVYVYSRKYNGENTENCHSNLFEWIDGNTYPEIDKYKWMTYEEIKANRGIRAYYPLYESLTKRLLTGSDSNKYLNI